MNIIQWIKAKVYHHTMSHKRKKEQKMWLAKIKKATIDFPHIVEFEGDWSMGGYMDMIANWCMKHIGHCDGDCEWHSCEDSFDKWYDENNLDDGLDKMLQGSSGDEIRKIIDKHYELIKKLRAVLQNLIAMKEIG